MFAARVKQLRIGLLIAFMNCTRIRANSKGLMVTVGSEQQQGLKEKPAVIEMTVDTVSTGQDQPPSRVDVEMLMRVENRPRFVASSINKPANERDRATRSS